MKIYTLVFLIVSNITFAASFVPETFSANYEENLQSITGKVKKSFGKIDYQFPGHLKFEVTSPVSSLFVVNPQKTWFYQPAFVKGESDQVTIQKSSNLPLVKFLDSVKNGLENSKIFTAQKVGPDLILTFNKKSQKEMGFVEVVLHGAKEGNELKELKFVETITLKHLNKNKTTIKLIDLKESVKFPTNYFEFTPSSSTKVINN